MLEYLREGQQGPWEVDHFEISRKAAISYAIGAIAMGEIFPLPGKYTRLTHATRGVVMSDTRQELIQMGWLRQILHSDPHGPVFINGLGLGIAAKMALDLQPNGVYVNEIDSDVIELVGKQLLKIYSDRLHIAQEDALLFKPEKSLLFNIVWHDIWDEVDDENWEQYKLLMRRWSRHAIHQNAWGRYEILRIKRKDRRQQYGY